MTRLVSLSSCGALLAVTIGVAAASAALADAASETVTAATHAELAAGASDLAGVHTHLHHTLNCLVGQGGNGFDAKQMNPCAESGKGAIPDSSDSAKKASLEKAAAKARDGIAASDMKAARADASATASMLKAAK